MLAIIRHSTTNYKIRILVIFAKMPTISAMLIVFNWTKLMVHDYIRLYNQL